MTAVECIYRVMGMKLASPTRNELEFLVKKVGLYLPGSTELPMDFE